MDEKELAMVKQKSCVQWVQEGDTNSKYFHNTIRLRRMSNDLGVLKLMGYGVRIRS